jgi:hypothetical protein
MDNAIAYVQKEEEINSISEEDNSWFKDKSVIISTFHIEGIEKALKIRLSRKYDLDDNFEWIYAWIDTPWKDWVKDSEVSQKINWEVSEVKINTIITELKIKYEWLYNKNKKEVKKKVIGFQDFWAN